LETALIGTPVLVAYKVSFISELVARLLVNVDYISLPNLIAGQEIYPEYIQKDACADTLALAVHRWLDDPTEYARVKHELTKLRTMVGEPGAPLRAARVIMDDLAELGR